MEINLIWDFRQAVKNIQAIKREYISVLSSFNLLNYTFKKVFIKAFRDKIYALKLDEWQKDRLWEYMNDDIEYETLIEIVIRSSNRQKRIKMI